MEEPLLNLVVIRSNDIERSAGFYRLIGLRLNRHRHGTGPEHYASEHGQTVFEIYPRQDGDDSTAGVRIGFSVHSVDGTVERLMDAGARAVSPAKDSPWGRRAVVEDPDGHRVELTELR